MQLFDIICIGSIGSDAEQQTQRQAAFAHHDRLEHEVRARRERLQLWRRVRMAAAADILQV